MHTTTTTNHHPHAHPGTPAPHQHQLLEPSRTQIRRLRRRGFRRVLAGAAALALAATGALAIAPGTAHADAHRDGQWYLDDFNIDKVHELSQGEGVTIGVIDSGIDADHPDLEGNIEAGTDYGDSTGKGLNDPVGHGTSVASVMAGHGHGKNNADGILGIAPKAKIISVGLVWDESPRQGDEISDAIQYLVDRDVNIITTGKGGSPDGIGDKAIEPATNAGIPIVAPAGNTAQTDDTTWPAKASGVIPVTGTNQDHKFWNGSTTLAYASQQPQLGLSAPATNIPIAMPNGKYDNADGTSFSVPIVAGTLALMKSAYPDLDLYTQQSRLLETVDDKGEKGFDDKYGWGIVNPYKALTEETTYTDADGNDTVSSPDDRLPLEEQGEPVSNVPPPDAVPPPNNTPDLGDKHKDKDEAAAEAPGPPAWLTITIITAGALLTAALITLVIVKTRRGKKNHTSQTTGPPPHGHPGGPTPPPQHNPDQAPPPHAYEAPNTPPAPGSLPPQAPPPQPGQPGQPGTAGTSPAGDSPWQPGHTPQQNAGQTPGPSQPGQPDPATAPPPQNSPWQPPQDPDTNPPPHQPPQ